MELMEWKNLNAFLNSFAEKVIREYRDLLVMEKINASRRLSDSLQYRIEKDRQGFEVSLELSPWWKYVEEGVNGTDRNNGSPYSFSKNKVMIPVKAVREWIRVKPIIPQKRNGKLPTPQSLAYIMARSIHEKGYEGKHPLSRTLKDLNDELEEGIGIALSKDIDDLLKRIFNPNE